MAHDFRRLGPNSLLLFAESCFTRVYPSPLHSIQVRETWGRRGTHRPPRISPSDDTSTAWIRPDRGRGVRGDFTVWRSVHRGTSQLGLFPGGSQPPCWKGRSPSLRHAGCRFPPRHPFQQLAIPIETDSAPAPQIHPSWLSEVHIEKRFDRTPALARRAAPVLVAAQL